MTLAPYGPVSGSQSARIRAAVRVRRCRIGSPQDSDARYTLRGGVVPSPGGPLIRRRAAGAARPPSRSTWAARHGPWAPGAEHEGRSEAAEMKDLSATGYSLISAWCWRGGSLIACPGAPERGPEWLVGGSYKIRAEFRLTWGEKARQPLAGDNSRQIWPTSRVGRVVPTWQCLSQSVIQSIVIYLLIKRIHIYRYYLKMKK